jgi:hypothetical protein
MGNVTLVIQGINYDMTPSDWQLPPTHEKIKQNDGTEKDVVVCHSAIMEMQVMNEMLIAGTRFMRRLYTIYDRDHDRVGIAKSSNLAKIEQIYSKDEIK